MRTTKLWFLGLLLGAALLPAPAIAGPDDERRADAAWRMLFAGIHGRGTPHDAVPITREALLAGLRDGTLKPIGPVAAVHDMLRAHARMREDRAEARRIFPGDFLARHTTEPRPGNPRVRELPDGNWLYRFGAGDPRTGEGARYAVLQGNLHNYGELVQAHRQFFRLGNQQGIYARLFDALPEDFVRRNGLPDPTGIGELSFEQMKALNEFVVSQWEDFEVPGVTKPPGYPTSAAAEEGAGFGGDNAVLTTPMGLWASSLFPLKWCTTSVKSQGMRGTCTAFAITAAVETTIACQQGRWVNLSEQMLYNRAKFAWEPSHYGDGIFVGVTLGNMLFTDYRYSWEATWDYNRSLARIDLGFLYDNSCVAALNPTVMYAGEMCSETNHQATAVCTQTIPVFCAAVDAAQSIAPDAKFRITGLLSINQPGAVDLAFAKAFLAAKVPVILSVTVPTDQMDDDEATATNGLLNLDPAQLVGDGGHAMLLVGYVPNAALPAGTTPGGGGGYFICKNSWNWDYADAGYIYLSDQWVAYWAKGMWVATGVTEAP